MKYSRIGVHDGDFHLDELIAIATLRIQNPLLEILRTRDLEVLSSLDARIDVGGKYSLETHDFDHHQKGGAGKRENGVPYASAGLIWNNFGRVLCNSDESHLIVDKKLIQYVDAEDTGFGGRDNKIYSLADVIRKFKFRHESDKCLFQQAFNNALDISQMVLENEILSSNSQVDTNQVVRRVLNDFKGLPYVILDRDSGWQDVLVQESDKNFVIYQSPDGNYRVRAIPTEVDGLNLRLPLPESWAGLKGDNLSQVSGVEDAVFCHPNKFMAGAKSLDGAIRLAKKASGI